MPDPAHRARKSSHGPSKHVPGECACVRCQGFQKGHQYSVGHGHPTVHGAKMTKRSILRHERTLELAAEIRERVPVHDLADDFAIQSLAILLVRIERAQAALEQLEAELDPDGTDPLNAYRAEDAAFNADSLRKDLRSWLSVSERYFSALGMSPGSRARLGLDIARARSLTVVDWHRLAAAEDAES